MSGTKPEQIPAATTDAVALTTGAESGAGSSGGEASSSFTFGVSLMRSQEEESRVLSVCQIFLEYYTQAGGINPVVTHETFTALTSSPPGAFSKFMNLVTRRDVDAKTLMKTTYLPGFYDPRKGLPAGLLDNLALTGGASVESRSSGLEIATLSTLVDDVMQLLAALLEQVLAVGAEGRAALKIGQTKKGALVKGSQIDKESERTAFICAAAGQCLSIMLASGAIKDKKRSESLKLLAEVVSQFLRSEFITPAESGLLTTAVKRMAGTGLVLSQQAIILASYERLLPVKAKLYELAEKVNPVGLDLRAEYRKDALTKAVNFLRNLNVVLMQLVFMDCPTCFEVDSQSIASRCGFGNDRIPLTEKLKTFLRQDAGVIQFYWAFILSEGRWQEWQRLLSSRKHDYDQAFTEFSESNPALFSIECESFQLFEMISPFTALAKRFEYKESSKSGRCSEGAFYYLLNVGSAKPSGVYDDRKSARFYALRNARPFAYLNLDDAQYYPAGIDSSALPSSARQKALLFSMSVSPSNEEARLNYRKALTDLLLLRDKLTVLVADGLNIAVAYKALGEFVTGSITATLEADACKRLTDCISGIAITLQNICLLSSGVGYQPARNEKAFDELFRYRRSIEATNYEPFIKKAGELFNAVGLYMSMGSARPFMEAATCAVTSLEGVESTQNIFALAENVPAARLGGMDFLRKLQSDYEQLTLEMEARETRAATQNRFAIAGALASSDETRRLESAERAVIKPLSQKHASMRQFNLKMAARACSEAIAALGEAGMSEDRLLDVGSHLHTAVVKQAEDEGLLPMRALPSSSATAPSSLAVARLAPARSSAAPFLDDACSRGSGDFVPDTVVESRGGVPTGSDAYLRFNGSSSTVRSFPPRSSAVAAVARTSFAARPPTGPSGAGGAGGGYAGSGSGPETSSTSKKWFS